MRVNKYEPAMYYLLRAKQIKLMQDSIAWREDNIKALSKKKKRAKSDLTTA